MFIDFRDKEVKYVFVFMFVEIFFFVVVGVNRELNVSVLKGFVDMMYYYVFDFIKKIRYS